MKRKTERENTVKRKTASRCVLRAMMIIMLVVVLLGVSMVVFAQSTWTKVLRADGGGQTVVNVSEAGNGDYFAAGYTMDYYAYDFLVLRLAPDGQVLWQKTYGGTGYDVASWIEATPDGGCIVAGETTSYGDGALDAWLIKLAADGTIEWQETLGGAAETWIHCIRSTSDGGYIACGDKGDDDFGRLDGMLVRLDRQGKVLWERLYGGSKENAFYGIQTTSDGGYIVYGATGLTASLDSSLYAPWYAKVDSNGHCEWQMSIPGINWGQATTVLQSLGGGLFVAGYDGDSNNLFIGSLDSDRELSWIEEVPSYGSYSLCLTRLSSENILLGARIQTENVGFPWCGLVGMDTNGKMEWNEMFKTDKFINPSNALALSEGGYLFAGHLGTKGYSPDAVLLKTDSVGDLPEQCLTKGQQDLETKPLEVSPVRLVCREWTSSSLVLKSNAVPSVYGCTGLEDSLEVVNASRWYGARTDLKGCNTDPPTYAWDFGDGSTSGAQGVYHTYHLAGTYDAHLRVTVGRDTCMDSAKITVLAQPCEISCTASAQVVDLVNLGVQFSAETVVGDCSMQPAYQWDFGDGWESTGQSPVHYYSYPEQVTWALTVRAGNATYTTGGTIDLTHLSACDGACWANFANGPVVGTNEPALFDAGLYGTPCQDVPSVDWDFDGDGTIDANGLNVSHIYTQPGTYHWTARVSLDGNVCMKDGYVPVYDNPLPPVVTGMTKRGNPFRLIVTGTNFHPDMKVWIADAATPWTQFKQTSTRLVIKKAKKLFPKDGSATTIMLENGDGGISAFTYNRKKKIFENLDWGALIFPPRGIAYIPSEAHCASTSRAHGHSPDEKVRGLPSINRLGIKWGTSRGTNQRNRASRGASGK